ncbi:DUF7079 family protein [Tahibacter harae]|uniref:DUF7079 domain-containing protein n=1 Tax=Tahibacter harae TaxID=2963937 RepID=A0ABT1QTN8_9GAMM|nr:hypothetical protein [Tahibacter harae]MCQ4165646.1 hypothetical protein [Tahibacter harae]
MNPADDLAARRPVWQAFALLYLDSDIEAALPGIAATLAAAPYSVAQLHDILRYEVNPVLHWNLHATAGVWDGFDADWLEREILRRSRRPRWLRALTTQRALRWHWAALAAEVQRRREAAHDAGNAPGHTAAAGPPH